MPMTKTNPKKTIIINDRPQKVQAIGRFFYETPQQKEAIMRNNATGWDEHLDDEQHQVVWYYRYEKSE